MENFTYHNPVKIVFGKGTISQLNRLIRRDQKIMILYGGGSIKKNGVYDQVISALDGYDLVEFAGIEPNPQYDTCVRATATAKSEKVDFLLAVGGGSVLDATKFIAAAIPYKGKDTWDILTHNKPIRSALPLGSVLTLPATGSEMNTNAVISRDSTGEKLAFSSSRLYPVFSILDPETTFSLPRRYVINGIVDSFVHVTEQYLTYDVRAPLQDRQAEAILLTLIDIGPQILRDPEDYDVRAALMWCSTNALNGLIGCGVPGDWATHIIGHELTVLHGLDHAQTLAIVLPAVLSHQKTRKAKKLVQFAERVWDIEEPDEERKIDMAIERTKAFFNHVGMPTRLRDCGITASECLKAAERIDNRGVRPGEHGDIRKKQIEEILFLAE